MLPVDKQVFPNLDVVGWYTTGSEITEADMQIHRKVGPTSICAPSSCAAVFMQTAAYPCDPPAAALGGSLSNLAQIRGLGCTTPPCRSWS